MTNGRGRATGRACSFRGGPKPLPCAKQEEPHARRFHRAAHAVAGRLSDPVFRIAVSLTFVIGGLGHFFRPQEMLDRIAESPWAPVAAMFGDPLLHLWWTGGVFVVAGLFLAIGYSTRLAALLLFVALIPVTVVVHVVPDSSRVGPLFKNVAILGVLLFIAINGARCCALDVRRSEGNIA